MATITQGRGRDFGCPRYHSQRIGCASQPLAAQRTAIQALNPDQLLKLRHEWTWWARDEQKPPPSDWRVWLYLAGRGAGKTRSAPNGSGRRKFQDCRRKLPSQRPCAPRLQPDARRG